jgi:hypothetical protein
VGGGACRSLAGSDRKDATRARLSRSERRLRSAAENLSAASSSSLAKSRLRRSAASARAAQAESVAAVTAEVKVAAMLATTGPVSLPRKSCSSAAWARAASWVARADCAASARR